MSRAVIIASVLMVLRICAMAEGWQEALASMPLARSFGELNRTNCVQVMLQSFRSNSVVKGLVFMPGATDELYMFKRVEPKVAVPSPTLLEAVQALTNGGLVRATFRSPLLLLHTAEDSTEPLIRVMHPGTMEKLKAKQFIPHACYNDRDWDTVQPVLRETLRMDFRPWRYYYDSWHFYRHSYAGWNLSGWEAVEATALAGKTIVTVKRNRVEFEADPRIGTAPKLDHFPR